MIPTTALEDALQETVVWALSQADDSALRLTGDKVIWARQSQNKPGENYISLMFLTAPMSRNSAQDYLDVPACDSPSDEAVLSGERVFTLSCRSFGPRAYDLLVWVDAMKDRPAIRAELEKPQISVVTITKAAAGDYKLTLKGVEVTYTAVTGKTVTQIRDGLLALVQANEWIASDALTAVATSTDKITITGPRRQEFTCVAAGNLSAAISQYARDIAIVETLGVLDLSPLRQAGFEMGASLDLRIRTSLAYTTALEYFDTVEITDLDRDNTAVVGGD